jgi:D-alanine-D-alanine ligase and related ATP-grasp enzymes
MNITILYDTFEDREEYPGADLVEAVSTSKRKKKAPKTDREAISDALRSLGHEPSIIAVDGKLATLEKIARSKADLHFNLTESYGGDDTKEMHFAAFLDLMNKRYTGTGPAGSYLGMDKAIAKKIIRFHGLNTPFSAVLNKGRIEHIEDIKFPLIIKPATEDGSKGIDSNAVVDSIKDLMERVSHIHDEFDCAALLEEYIEGREIYAAVLGNDRPEALPLVELDLSKLPDGVPRIASYQVKFDTESDDYKHTKSAPAHDLDEDLIETIQKTAITTFQALKLRDYGRVDLRVTPEGQVYVIEANPNPWLDPTAEFYMAAKESGRSYTQLIGEIVDKAIARYE